MAPERPADDAGRRPTGSRRRAWVLIAATLFGVALTTRLGLWQLDRAAQKTALQQRLDGRAALPPLGPQALEALDAPGASSEDLLYRHLRITGRWIERATVYLDNRQMNGRPGFFVITPLQPEGGGPAVLVQRGWIPRDANERTRLAPVSTPAGDVAVYGRIAPPPSRLYEFSAAASGPIRQNLDLDAYAHETGLSLRPVSIVEDDPPGTPGAGGANPAADGLWRHWPPPAIDVSKHLGYAVQWFALGALMAGLYVWFQLVRPRLRRRP